MHTSPDILVLLALGEDIPVGDREHVAGCDVCQRELSELTQTVSVARSVDSGDTLQQPPPSVWAAIRAELGFDSSLEPGPASTRPANGVAAASPLDQPTTPITPADGHAESPAEPASPELARRAPAEPSRPIAEASAAHAERGAYGPQHDRSHVDAGPVGPSSVRSGGAADPAQVEPDEAPRAPRSRRILSLALAAAFALVAGIGIGVGVSRSFQTQETVISRADLEAFPSWPGVTGTAVVERDADGNRELKVVLNTPAPKNTRLQVWLIDEQAESMSSLGFLRSNGTGRWPIPDQISLAEYPQVDVSAEPPNDLDVGHSGNSIVRGSLAP